MAITRVQQSQISGSLSYNDALTIDDSLKNKASLAGDLDALRSLIKDIKGSDASHWFDSASQDLSDIHAAMHASGADADFQGKISSVDKATLDSLEVTNASVLKSTLEVQAKATLDSLEVTNASVLKDTLEVQAKATLKAALEVDGAVDLSATGLATKIYGTLDVAEGVKLAKSGTQTEIRGDVKVDEGAEIVGDFKADAKVDLSDSGKATKIYGTLDVAEGVKLAKIGTQTEVRGDLKVGEGAEIVGDFKADAVVDLSASGKATSVKGTLDVAEGVKLAASGIQTEVRGDLKVDEGAEIVGDFRADGDVYLGDASSDRVYFNAKSASDLDMNSHKISGIQQASSNGEALAWGQDANVAKIEASGVATFDASAYIASDLGVSGSLAVHSLATFDGGVEISGDKLELTGSLGVKGDSMLDGKLEVSGSTKLDGDVYLGDSSSDSLTFNAKAASALDMNNHKVSNLTSASSAGDAIAFRQSGAELSDLKVTGLSKSDMVYVDNSGKMATSANAQFDGMYLTLAAELQADGGIDVNGGKFNVASASGNTAVGGTLASSGDFSVATSKFTVVAASGNTAVAGTLESDGDFSVATDKFTVASASGNVVSKGTLSVDGTATFKANVEVKGDLHVEGSMTYIDTANMRVQDAFIYLATGSAGTTDSGIVLHGGAGAGMDLVIGQSSGAGDVIFGKMDRSPDGNGAMADISLVGSWMKEVKFGIKEGELSGSLAVDGSDMKLSAAAELKLEAGSELFSLAIAGDQAAFEAEFGAGKSIIGAIVAAATGGNYKKGSIDATAGQANLDFSSIGALRAGYDSEKDLDVFLNGVLLVASDDYALANDHTVTLNYNFSAGDKMTVIIRNAA